MKKFRVLIAILFLSAFVVSASACKSRKGGKGCNCPTWQKPSK